eukprot:EC120388.1.p1 GENE.EC120388.1~~EC120388.1.p1  ORF type:complete len:135 (+),score=19.82 EC120388.1:28-405(+)
MGFWRFANEVFTVDEAKKAYPLLGIGGNIPSLFVGGAIVHYVSALGAARNSFDFAVRWLMAIVCVCIVVVAQVFNMLTRYLANQPKPASTSSQSLAPAPVKYTGQVERPVTSGVTSTCGSIERSG